MPAAWLDRLHDAPAERIDDPTGFWLYRLRWQMELEIKRDKSIGGIDKLPNFLDDTIATWLYAKLLIQQIARKIVSPSVAFPPSAVGIAALPVPSGGSREAPPPHRRVVVEMWRVMVLVYQAIHAALLPLRRLTCPTSLDVFLEHIGHRNEKTRPKQTELFWKGVLAEAA